MSETDTTVLEEVDLLGNKSVCIRIKIDLAPSAMQFIQERVQSGLYLDEGDVISDIIRKIQQISKTENPNNVFYSAQQIKDLFLPRL